MFLTMFWKSLNIVLAMHISDVFDNDFKKMKTAVYLLNLFHTGWHKLLLNHSTERIMSLKCNRHKKHARQK